LIHISVFFAAKTIYKYYSFVMEAPVDGTQPPVETPESAPAAEPTTSGRAHHERYRAHHEW